MPIGINSLSRAAALCPALKTPRSYLDDRIPIRLQPTESSWLISFVQASVLLMVERPALRWASEADQLLHQHDAALHGTTGCADAAAEGCCCHCCRALCSSPSDSTGGLRSGVHGGNTCSDKALLREMALTSAIRATLTSPTRLWSVELPSQGQQVSWL